MLPRPRREIHVAARHGEPGRLPGRAALILPACGAIAVALALVIAAWLARSPSGHRDWADDVAHIVTGTVSGQDATLYNLRNFSWRSETDYSPAWETRCYRLDALSSVDLFLSSWGKPAIAHALVSFCFADGAYVVFSFEIRRRRGQKFSELAGFFRQYELALIAADERDVVLTRTNVRWEDVSRFRVNLDAEQRRKLFLAYIARGNQLAAAPEFYNTLTANCAADIFRMMRAILPGLHYDYRILLTGYLPSYIYKLGGFDAGLSLAELKARARVSALARQIGDVPDFSRRLRENQPILYLNGGNDRLPP